MKNKENLLKLKKNYIKVPNKIVTMELEASEIGLYLFLASCSQEFNPSLRFLSKALNVSIPTVRKYLTKLLERNIIEKYVSGGVNEVTRYKFVEPFKWKKVERRIKRSAGRTSSDGWME